MTESESRRPRVALLHYTTPPVVGGVETVLARHARQLALEGFDVSVLTGRGESLGAGVRLHRLPLLDSRHPRVLAVARDLEAGRITAAFPALTARIGEDLERALAGIDVCVAHNVLTLHKNLALTAALHQIAARKSSPRIVVWCHDLAWTNPLYGPHLHPGAPWDLLRTRVRGGTYVAVSRARQQALCAALGLAGPAVAVIPNGIDPAVFLRLTGVGRWLADTLRLWDHQIVLLLPARITRRKQIEYALAVASEIVRRELTVRLLVTGPLGAHNPRNRSYLQELRALRRRLGLEEHVVFCTDLRGPRGRPLVLSDRTMADLYMLADALLLPSRDEGFGLPLLEAGLARLPAFTTDLAALRAVGDDAIHTFDLGDPPARVAAAIIDTLMEERGYRLRRRVLASYRWSVIMREQIVPLLSRAAAAVGS
ncbi:MAG TPA: glycosyltransferase family 4 protein [bacterium]|nr:glycosyltransferase family 4 protein [bacterium]